MEPPCRRTVEEVFADYQGRRSGLIKALTTDADEFLQQCDPENPNVCLYGLPDGEWAVEMPAEEVPPELPEPTLGINFSRDDMIEKDYLSLVAVHSDSWLLAVAYYFGARFHFDSVDRHRLFNMINDLPTVSEVVTEAPERESTDISTVTSESCSKCSSNSKVINYPKTEVKEEYENKHGSALQVNYPKTEVKEEYDSKHGIASQTKYPKTEVKDEYDSKHGIASQTKYPKTEVKDEYENKHEVASQSRYPKNEVRDEDEEMDDEDDENLCLACGEKYRLGEFWIYCNFCERWFHGKCVKMTPSKADQIEKYRCPSCIHKRARPPPG